MTHGMDRLYVGDQIEVIVGPDQSRFTGVLCGWDGVAVYVHGLGFPVEDILEMNLLVGT